MKFLHCSDLHLGKKPYFGSEDFRNKRFEDYFSAFDRIIEQAKENEVDAILVAGDFFDKKETHPNILSNTVKLLQKCKDYDIQVIVIEGNHDLIYKDREFESWIIYLEKEKLLRRPFKYNSVFVGETEIFGLGYPGAFVDDELLEFANYCEKENKRNCVVLVHTSLGDGEFIGGFLKNGAALDALKNYAIYIGGGHGHKLQKYPKENPFFFAPGSPEYYDLGEDTQFKTAIIFDTNTKEYKILEQSPRKCIKKNIILQSATQEEFREEVEKFLSQTDVSSDDIVLLTVEFPSAVIIPDTAWAEKRILEEGVLFAKVELKRKHLRFGSNSAKVNSIEEIELEQIKKWEQWGGVAEIAAKALAEMRNSVKEGQSDISSIFESALESAIGGKNENK
ncbi:MAG: exonuclease SbcCD subunit D [Fibromonadales bacterium]|nr:exonuclease SbcCD subunit D [Fibromonadales bacterium]